MSEELPRRPRRKLVTPLTATLAAVLIGALGFIGGVQVQKSSADSSASPRAAGFTRGAGGFTPGGGGSSDATVGTVANVNGKTLYITDSSGATIRVKTTAHSKIALRYCDRSPFGYCTTNLGPPNTPNSRTMLTSRPVSS